MPMKIYLESVFRAKDERLRFLREQGLPEPVVEAGMTTIHIAEDDPRVAEIHQQLCKWETLIRFATEFTTEELEEAAYLRVYTVVPRGYPQPDDGTYFENTYQPDSYCSACYLGKRQVNPFRVKRIPRVNERTLFSMYWLESELFMTRRLFDSVFAPFGAKWLPLLLHSTGEAIGEIVQLDSRDVPVVQLDIVDEPYKKCSVCGGEKYVGPKMGPNYPFLQAMTDPIVRSDQSFGMGKSSAPKVYFAQRLYRAICEARVRGVNCVPVASCREELVTKEPWLR